jgi:hypothetical protein
MGQPGQDITQVDPVSLAAWQGEQEISQLAAFDQQLAQVKVPLQQSLDTSYEQYQVDLNAIRNSGMERDQQRARINQLNANYQKKWIGIKAKVEPQVRAITEAREAAHRQVRLGQALRMKEIQTYASLAEQGVLTEEVARSLQYKTLGIEVPVTAFKPPKTQSPYQVVQQNRQLMTSIQGLIGQFRMEPARDRPFKRWDEPARLMVLKPQTEWTGADRYGRPAPDEKRDYVPASPEQIRQYDWALDAQERLREESRAAAEQLIGKRVTDLAGAASPMASGVRQAKPKPRGGGRKLTQQDIDSIMVEAQGDWKRATEIARQRGFSVGE